VDHESRLFQTMTHSHDDVKWNMVNTTSTAGGWGFNLSGSLYPAMLPPALARATNLVSNNVAALVHFNGPKFPLGDEEKPGWMWLFHLFPEVTDVNRRCQTGKKSFGRHIEMVRGAEARFMDGGWSGKKFAGPEVCRVYRLGCLETHPSSAKRLREGYE